MHLDVLVVGLAVGLAGCTLITDSFLTNEFSGDAFPIDIETQTGAIVVGMRQAGQDDRVAVVDLLSPFTLTDPGPAAPPSVSYVDLTLLGKTGPPGGAIDLTTAVPRARFKAPQILALHPCPDSTADGAPNPDCTVGVPGATRVFRSIIGAAALAGDAVRLRIGDNQMFILADVGGDDRGRTLSCDAVFNAPYRGGGTLVIAGTELPFGGRRITLQACLGPDRDPAPEDPAIPIPLLRQHGANVLLVVSTSIGMSILGQAAYERYRLEVATEAPTPAFEDLPPGAVYLPSGLVEGRLATIDRLALVGTSSASPLAPCRQIYAHHFFTQQPEQNVECPITGEGTDCPCKDGAAFCPVPAMLALSPPAGIAVLVVADTDPTLQALRTELRPDQPEVDGLLGTDVLRAAEIDVDYPHNRLVARCVGADCVARPQFAEASYQRQIKGCLALQPTGPILPD